MLRRIKIDYTSGVVEFVTEDGQVFSASLGDSGLPTAPLIERAIYEPPRSTVAFDVTGVGAVSAEVSAGSSDAVMRRERPAVYLDQNMWIALARSLHSPARLPVAERNAAAELIGLARSGDVLFPMSAAHVLETAHADGRWRRDLAEVLLGLSRGWQLRDPMQMQRSELVIALQRRVGSPGVVVQRPSVVTLEPDAIWQSSQPRRASGTAARSGDSDSGSDVALFDLQPRRRG